MNVMLMFKRVQCQFSETFTFVPPSLGELNVVRVRLEYPNSPSADPLHGSVHVGALGQARDLGGWSSHARGRDPGLDACRILKNYLNFVNFANFGVKVKNIVN